MTADEARDTHAVRQRAEIHGEVLGVLHLEDEATDLEARHELRGHVVDDASDDDTPAAGTTDHAILNGIPRAESPAR